MENTEKETGRVCLNTLPCTCPNVNCDFHGRCCACVARHRKKGNPPNCYKFPSETDEA